MSKITLYLLWFAIVAAMLLGCAHCPKPEPPPKDESQSCDRMEGRDGMSGTMWNCPNLSRIYNS